MDSNINPFKIGLVGCGRISQSYFEAIQRLKGVSLAAVMDLREDAAEALAEQSDSLAFNDLDSYLEKSNVQASIVCTPPCFHKETSWKLLESGHHVLCEKPLATSLEDGIQMMNVARKHKKHLMMASKFRFVDDVIRAKGIISSGILGHPLYYENCFSGNVNMSERWNSTPEISGGGVLVDNGTHSVDIVRYLLGPIKSVSANNLSVQSELPVEDTVMLSFLTTDGVKGTISLSWKFSVDRNAYIGIYGGDGRLHVNWHEACYQYSGNPEWIPFGYGYDKIEAFKKQVLNFIGTIRGNTEPLIKEIDSLASVAVIEASYRSLKSGSWENVDKEYA